MRGLLRFVVRVCAWFGEYVRGSLSMCAWFVDV